MLFAKAGDRVEAEEEALAAAGGHPGVVAPVGVEEGVLRTRMVDGCSLAELGPLAADEVAGVAAAVAATLADLHDLGLAHGGIEAAHVLVGRDGRVVLCSLGRGGDPAGDVAALGRLVEDLLGAGPEGAAPGPATDPVPGSPPPLRRRSGPAGTGARWSSRQRSRLRMRARLGAMLEPPAGPALAAVAADATHPDPARRPTARAFAAAVHQGVPGARVPLPPARPLLPAAAERPRTGRRVPRSRSRTGRRVLGPGAALPFGLALASLAGSAAVVVLLTSALTDRGRGRPPTGTVPPRPGAVSSSTTGAVPRPGAVSSSTTGKVPRPPGAAVTSTTAAEAPAPPVATQVWPPAPLHYADGVLTVGGARYALGQPGDAVASGDWACTGQPTVALLRAATGEVFAFDGWAGAGDTVAGRRLGRVAGATGLRAADVDGDGCDDLEVERPGAPPERLEVAS